MKVCSNCGSESDNFNRRGKSLQPYCRKCQKDFRDIHYQNNKKYYVDKNKRNRDKIKDAIKDAKSRPCADCKISYPYYVMDLDHLRDKDFNIAGSYNLKGLITVLAEIKKCEAVCANCHRERTHKNRI